MTMDATATRTTLRIALASLIAVTVGAGLLVHRFGDGPAGDIAGDALYAVMIYLLTAFIFPSAPAVRRALVAVVVCFGIELLQLTGLPRAWSSVFPPAQLVFGSGFDPRDLVVYASAILIAMLVEVLIGRMLRASIRRRETPEGALLQESAL